MFTSPLRFLLCWRSRLAEPLPKGLTEPGCSAFHVDRFINLVACVGTMGSLLTAMGAAYFAYTTWSKSDSLAKVKLFRETVWPLCDKPSLGYYYILSDEDKATRARARIQYDMLLLLEPEVCSALTAADYYALVRLASCFKDSELAIRYAEETRTRAESEPIGSRLDILIRLAFQLGHYGHHDRSEALFRHVESVLTSGAAAFELSQFDRGRMKSSLYGNWAEIRLVQHGDEQAGERYLRRSMAATKYPGTAQISLEAEREQWWDGARIQFGSVPTPPEGYQLNERFVAHKIVGADGTVTWKRQRIKSELMKTWEKLTKFPKRWPPHLPTLDDVG